MLEITITAETQTPPRGLGATLLARMGRSRDNSARLTRAKVGKHCTHTAWREKQAKIKYIYVVNLLQSRSEMAALLSQDSVRIFRLFVLPAITLSSLLIIFLKVGYVKGGNNELHVCSCEKMFQLVDTTASV